MFSCQMTCTELLCWLTMPPLLRTGAYFVTTCCAYFVTTVVYNIIRKCYLGVCIQSIIKVCRRQLGEWLGYLDLGEVSSSSFGWLAGEPFFGL